MGMVVVVDHLPMAGASPNHCHMAVFVFPFVFVFLFAFECVFVSVFVSVFVPVFVYIFMSVFVSSSHGWHVSQSLPHG